MSTQQELLLRVQGTRMALEDIEAKWKRLRLENRHYLMELYFVHGFSINRLSQLSGHYRNTLTAWRDRDLAEGKWQGYRAGHGAQEDSSDA